ncbi:MAG: ATPase, partial [Methanobrevibacter sp.]|nr:ATPase [Methanobrevibacter sp.]
QQEEVGYYAEEPAVNKVANDDDFIYPDHSYEPQPTSARMDLEDKYEKYLDDLYFDETEVPLDEQLAKDEEQYGSLTKRKYKPQKAPAKDQKRAKSKKPETPEEMEARIRAEIMAEQGTEPKKGRKSKDKNIHNLNYQDEKEPMGVIDILLTIILVIVILVVIYYLIYLFVLSTSYPTFMDAVFGLTNPQNVINNIVSSRG